METEESRRLTAAQPPAPRRIRPWRRRSRDERRRRSRPPRGESDHGDGGVATRDGGAAARPEANPTMETEESRRLTAAQPPAPRRIRPWRWRSRDERRRRSRPPRGESDHGDGGVATRDGGAAALPEAHPTMETE